MERTAVTPVVKEVVLIGVPSVNGSTAEVLDAVRQADTPRVVIYFPLHIISSLIISLASLEFESCAVDLVVT